MTVGYHSVDDLASMEDPQKFLANGQRPYAGNTPAGNTPRM